MNDLVTNAASEGIGDTIAAMFAVPESHFVEQAEESLTLGGASYETGRTDVQAPQPDEPWDPFAGW